VYAGKPRAAPDRHYLRDLFEVTLLEQGESGERVLVYLSGARPSSLGRCE